MNNIITGHAAPNIPPFTASLPHSKLEYTLANPATLQVNLGRLCNLACRHCHVSCGPTRKEIMERPIMESCLLAIKNKGIKTLDITGGAPEMNPHFRWFLKEGHGSGAHVIVRTNLVILTEEGYRDLPSVYADYGTELFCSLPCYTEENTDNQRGDGVFQRSVAILKELNQLGYGHGGRLKLNLVYNPGGAFLPPMQAELEADYREELRREFSLEVDNLYAITNNPVGRFYDSLRGNGELDGYMELLVNNFNPKAAANIMCRDQVSVGWDGTLYDCDFNQAAGLTIEGGHNIAMWAFSENSPRKIRFGNHCYACTAGCGSSCGGTTTA